MAILAPTVRVVIFTLHLPIAHFYNRKICFKRMVGRVGCLPRQYVTSSSNHDRTKAANVVVIHDLKRAGVIVSEKPVTHPKTKMGFPGKVLKFSHTYHQQ